MSTEPERRGCGCLFLELLTLFGLLTVLCCMGPTVADLLALR